MKLQERIDRLEDEIIYLRAIVDGGEVQQREAIVVTIGLLASFAAQSSSLDLGRLDAFLSDNCESEPSRDDRTAMLLHGVRLILAYHRDLGSRQSEPASVELLTSDEERELLRRAKAAVEFERRDRHLSRGGSARAGSRGGSDGSRH